MRRHLPFTEVVQHEYVRMIMENVPLHFLVVREDRGLVHVNPTLDAALEREEGVRLPERCYELFGYAGPCCDCMLDRCRETMGEVQRPLATVPCFGSVRFSSIVNFPLRDAEGRDTGLFMEILFDRTEEVELEQRLEHDFDAMVEMFYEILIAQESEIASRNEQIAVFSLQLGREMGLREGELRELRAAALLHNLGKISIYQERVKASSDPAFCEIEDYSVQSARLLDKIERMRGIADIIRFHRAPFDPDDVSRKVPLGSSILRLAILIVDYLSSLRDLSALDSASERLLIQLIRGRAGLDFAPGMTDRFVRAVSALASRGAREGGGVSDARAVPDGIRKQRDPEPLRAFGLEARPPHRAEGRGDEEGQPRADVLCLLRGLEGDRHRRGEPVDPLHAHRLPLQGLRKGRRQREHGLPLPQMRKPGRGASVRPGALHRLHGGGGGDRARGVAFRGMARSCAGTAGGGKS